MKYAKDVDHLSVNISATHTKWKNYQIDFSCLNNNLPAALDRQQAK